MKNVAKVNDLMAKVNALQAEIEVIKQRLTGANTPVLLQEIMNLLDRVGEGYVEGDYYAPSRYYSKIEGIKNIRELNSFLYGDVIEVKVTSPIGKLIPSRVEVKGVIYDILISYSKNYREEVDY